MYGLYCSFAICKYWDPGYRRSSLEKYCYSCTARTFYRAWVAKELVYVFKHSGLCSQDLLLEQEDNGMELAWQKLTMVWLKQSKLDSLISYWSTGFWFEAIKMEMNMCQSKSKSLVGDTEGTFAQCEFRYNVLLGCFNIMQTWSDIANTLNRSKASF